jgi:hypothetical protein
MKTLGSRLSFVIVIAVAYVIVACSGWSGQPSGLVAVSPTPAPNPTATPVPPQNWNKIETDHFVIFIPPDMKEKKVKGIDTRIWEYNSKEISLSIEAGFLGGDFGFIRNQYESSVEERVIGGSKAEYLTLDLNKPILKNWSFNADGSTKVPTERQNLVLGIYFPEEHISFVVSRTQEIPVNVAENILESITLK